MSKLVFTPAHQLAQMIRDKTVSAIEVLEAYITQIKKHNPQVNAIATLDEVAARKRAIAADNAIAKGEIWGKLHGVPITILDQPGAKTIQNLRIAWMDSWEEIPVASEIKKAIAIAANKLTQTGVNVEYWKPQLDLKKAFQACNQLTALNFIYSQPSDFDTAKKTFPVMFREATQGDKKLRKLSNLSHFLPSLLNPTLKSYFEILTYRDFLIAQMDEALKPWDVWLCPVAMTTAFTH